MAEKLKSAKKKMSIDDERAQEVNFSRHLQHALWMTLVLDYLMWLPKSYFFRSS